MRDTINNGFSDLEMRLSCPKKVLDNKKKIGYSNSQIQDKSEYRVCPRNNPSKLISGSEVFEYVTDGRGDLDVMQVLMDGVNQNLHSSSTSLRDEYDDIKRHQGLVGKTWDSMKNNIGLSRENCSKNNPAAQIWARYFNADDGSRIIDKKIDTLEVSVDALNQFAQKGDVKSYEKVFKAQTGQPFNPKALDSLNLLQNSRYEKYVKKYAESQENGVDNITDFAIWGAAAVGSSVLPAAGAIPVLANSVLCGAVANTGIKAVDKLTGGNKYQTLLTDVKDGAFAGLMNPVGDVLAVQAVASVAPTVGVKVTKEFLKGALPVDTVLSGGNALVHNLLGVLQSSVTWGAYEGSISGYKTLLYSKNEPEKRILNAAKDTAQWTGEGAFYGPIIDAALSATGVY